jgi:hypothetical protein
MTVAQKERVRFWVWLFLLVSSTGIAIGRLQLCVEKNTDDICSLGGRVKMAEDGIVNLRVEQAKLEAIHEDVRFIKRSLEHARE